MYIESLIDNNLTIRKEEPLDIGDILCFEDITVGIVTKIYIEKVEIKVFSKIFKFSPGANEGYYFSKNTKLIFVEYFNNILTPNGTMDQLKWEEEFEFVSILDEGCKVKSQDLIGYIKYGEIKYPVVVPDNIYDGILINPNPKNVNYSKPINVIDYKGIQYPIYLYQGNKFNLSKIPSNDNKSLVVTNRDFDQDLLKILGNYDIIIHFSSKKSKSYIQNAIITLKEFFNKAGVENVLSIGFNDYPYFSENYIEIIESKAKSMIEQLLIRGYNIIFFYEGIEVEKISQIVELEGEYKTKNSRNSSLRIVRLQSALLD
jgi:hypothetical protein